MTDSNKDSLISKYSNSRFSILTIMLGMTVCFSTLWRFPYQVASFGGIFYIIIYLLMIIFFVYPALTAEWGLGKYTQKGPDGAYEELNFPKWVSYILFGVVFLIGSYFIVWVGWILKFGLSAIVDSSLVEPTTNSSTYFNVNIVNEPIIQLVFAGLVLLLLSPTVLKGKNRIESISRIVVPIFFGFILFITSFIIIQPGIFSSIIDLLTKNSINTQVNSYTFIAALGQGFFSLCLGGTYMVLYASYMGKKENHDIPLNAGLTVIGNTFASLMSMILVFGIIVFSGINNFTSFGPGLFFSVIPEAFQQIGINIVFRQILLMLFFTMFFLSAYLPMVAILEVLITFTVKKFNVSRKKAFILIAPTLLIAAIPSVLSPLEGGFLYNLDIFVGALGSVFGSIMALLAFGWFIRKKDVMEIVNENSSSKLKFGEKWYFLTKYVTPFAIIFVILYALSDVIVGYFALNTIPENNYIFYSFIVEIAPVIAISLLIFSVLLYFITKRFSKIV